MVTIVAQMTGYEQHFFSKFMQFEHLAVFIIIYMLLVPFKEE
jgi:hypothetical protein